MSVTYDIWAVLKLINWCYGKCYYIEFKEEVPGTQLHKMRKDLVILRFKIWLLVTVILLYYYTGGSRIIGPTELLPLDPTVN